MRRVKSDVSHRIRRQPSIFSVGWFRVALGAGVALVLALLVGPSVAGWFGSDMPRSLFLLAPWSAPEKSAPPGAQTTSATRPSLASPGPSSSGSSHGAAAATGKAPAARVDGQPGTGGRVAAAGSAPASPSTPPASPPAPAPVTTTPPRDPAPPPSAAPVGATSLAPPPAVYWVQVGAFLDHRNADRLAERLRGDGLSTTTTSFEQSRVLYRVFLVSGEGGRVSEDHIDRVRGLGHPVETTADGPAVTGLVPLRRAMETSHALRQQGVPVRVKQEVSSATYRVVRVGSYATVAEADAALAALTARGVEGVVVRER